MKNFTLNANYFAFPEKAVKTCFRMGWMPERNSDTITVTVPEEDIELFEFIFDGVI